MNTHAQCGCLKGSVGLVDTQIRGAAGIVTPLMKGHAGLVDTQIRGSVGIICRISNDQILRFNQDKLLWTENENIVGNTKYNLLIASGDWKIEEVLIEELL